MGVGWDPNEIPQTRMLEQIRNLCAKPLVELDDEEIRLVVSQRMWSKEILELVVIKLRENPLRSGDMYDADILINTLKLPIAEWDGQEAHLMEFRKIARDTMGNIPTDGSFDAELLNEAFLDFEHRFLTR